MRVAIAIAAALLVGGCATQRVSLYPDTPGGSAGAVGVLNGQTETEVGALSEANTFTKLDGKTVKPQKITKPHTELLAFLPPPPRTYVMYFVPGKTDLTPESAPILEALRQAITPVSDVQIIGHSDTVGSLEDNDELSLKRATEVRAALVSQGLPVSNAKVTGRGERELRVKTADGVDEPANRRVEVILR